MLALYQRCADHIISTLQQVDPLLLCTPTSNLLKSFRKIITFDILYPRHSNLDNNSSIDHCSQHLVNFGSDRELSEIKLIFTHRIPSWFKLYKAFILPHLEYASPLFTRLSKCLCSKLETTNAFALRTLLNAPRRTTVLKIAGLKNLQRRRIEKALILWSTREFMTYKHWIIFVKRSSCEAVNYLYSLRCHFELLISQDQASILHSPSGQTLEQSTRQHYSIREYKCFQEKTKQLAFFLMRSLVCAFFKNFNITDASLLDWRIFPMDWVCRQR